LFDVFTFDQKTKCVLTQDVLLCVPGVVSIQLTEVRIPKHIAREESARLECKYDLGQESLYSVKWYKDGNEFYRYVPQERPQAQYFKLPGVVVDVSP